MSRLLTKSIRAIFITEFGIVLGVLTLYGLMAPPTIPTKAPASFSTGSYIIQELRRVPHQSTHYPLVLFSMQAQDYRKDAAIKFRYHPPEQSRPIYLQIEKDGLYRDMALVYHPLLSNLSWQSIYKNNHRLYQKELSYESIESLMAELPPTNELAADRVAANSYSLSSSQYTPLDTLADLGGIKYILTSYQPTPNDGWWNVFDQSFDLSDIAANSQNEIVGRISSLDDNSPYRTPFYIGDFHIDYKKMRP